MTYLGNRFFSPSMACMWFMFGKTSLASS